VLYYKRIQSLLVKGVVTASSHANRDKSSNCDIYVTCVDVQLVLMNYFGIELVLCGLYLTRFDLTKGLLFDTFFINVWYKSCRCNH